MDGMALMREEMLVRDVDDERVCTTTRYHTERERGFTLLRQRLTRR